MAMAQGCFDFSLAFHLAIQLVFWFLTCTDGVRRGWAGP